MNRPRLWVMGAGSIGCYLGGCLQAAGADVVLIGRPAVLQRLAAHGLRVSDLQGRNDLLPADTLQLAASPAEAGAAPDLVLFTVKSAATAGAGSDLAPWLADGTPVISLQNGLHNAEVLRTALPHCRVITGMVPFNVLQSAPGHCHQGSEGRLAMRDDSALTGFLPLFDNAGLPVDRHADMLAVQWAKLLLNLNNPINALSGLPLKAELSQRAYRRVLAAAQAEAIALLVRQQQPLARLTPLPPRWLPRLLCLPDVLFRLAAQRMLAMDPLARSSMWEDLEAGRPTEIDHINGEIVRLAAAQGLRAPVNERLIDLIRAAEAGGKRDWSGKELLAAVVAAH